jgi:gluconokinase
MDAVLAIDVGTTLCKAQCFAVDGRPLGPRLDAQTPVGPDGRADALDLAGTVEDIVDQFCSAVPRTVEKKPVLVAGCALTCSWHGLAGLEADGTPCTRVSTWMDRSAAEEALELRRLVADEGAVHQRTGCRLHPSYIPARLLRIKRRHAETWRRVSSWVSLGEFLQTRWCGPAVPSSLSMASASGLWDARGGLWDGELCGLLELPGSALPPVSDEWRRLSPTYRRRWPALAEALWTPALGDGACSVVGSTATADGPAPRRLSTPAYSAAVSLGTSAAARLLVEPERRLAQPLHPALFAYALDESRAVVGVARSNALNLVRWAERTLQLPSLAEDEDLVTHLLRERVPGSSGLIASSALAGERSPDWPVDGRGRIDGLSLASGPLDIAQSLLEDAVIGLVQAVAELERWTAGPLEPVFSGGGARSPGWQQLMADAFGRPVAISNIADTSLRGAALVCLERLGLLEATNDRRPGFRMIEPDPVRAAAFARVVGKSGR